MKVKEVSALHVYISAQRGSTVRSLVLVRDAALTRHRTHPVTVGGPDGVIVRVLRKVGGQFRSRYAATAARRVHAGLVHVSQHVVVHQVSALPGWSGEGRGGVVEGGGWGAGQVDGDDANVEGGGNGRRKEE